MYHSLLTFLVCHNVNFYTDVNTIVNRVANQTPKILRSHPLIRLMTVHLINLSTGGFFFFSFSFLGGATSKLL